MLPTSLRHPLEKLLEAEFFLGALIGSHDLEFQFNLNAFLGACRSVTFVLQKTFAGVEGFGAWYEARRKEMKADPAMGFFLELRNISQHEGQVSYVAASGWDSSEWSYRFAGSRAAVPEELRTVDIVNACADQLVKVAKVILDCSHEFPCASCPVAACSPEGMSALGYSLRDLSEALRLPSDWLEVGPGPVEVTLRFIAREFEPFDQQELARLASGKFRKNGLELQLPERGIASFVDAIGIAIEENLDANFREAVAIAALLGPAVYEHVSADISEPPSPSNEDPAGQIVGFPAISSALQDHVAEDYDEQTAVLSPTDQSLPAELLDARDANADELENPRCVEPAGALVEPEEFSTFIGEPGDDLPEPAAPMRPVSKYRPQLSQQSRARLPSQTIKPSKPATDQRTYEAEYMLTFGHRNWGFGLSALLRNPAGETDEMAVTDGAAVTVLAAIDDNFLEPLPIDDLAAALADGFAAHQAHGGNSRWERTGRLLHVFSERAGLGFTTAPRIIIGLENVVLCAEGYAQRVLAQIAATGAPDPVAVEGPGLPSGWSCWRSVWPGHPHAPESADPLLLALDPHPDTAIELIGGIPAARGQWIHGFPPSIRVVGLDAVTGNVTIDGQVALLGEDGGWTAPLWSETGIHRIAVGSVTRSFTIVPAEPLAPWWAANGHNIQVAGALGAAMGRKPAIILAGGPQWLVGAKPGQICQAVRRRGVHGAIASPDFEPVWSISRIPGKKRQQAFLIGSYDSPVIPVQCQIDNRWTAWADAIRHADGPPGGSDDLARQLWRQYCRAAAKAGRHRR